MGIQVFNTDGSVFFETGAHVLASVPGFAEKIGEVAATWAAAEGHLGCYYAILLDTTPDNALTQLGKQGVARVTVNAKAVASKKLTGNDLSMLHELLDKMDEVRKRRNRVQHDLWSRRTGDDRTLYAVHVDDYRRLFLEILENIKSNDSSTAADRSIAAANHYAVKASNAFTIESLENLRVEIEFVSSRLLQAFFENFTKV